MRLAHGEITTGNMAVPSRIFVKILLMVFFSRKEVLYRFQFHRQLSAILFLQFTIHSIYLWKLIIFSVINTGSILDPPVISLPVRFVST
jgi:hypothetical protein